MAAFFYPIEILVGVGVVLALALVVLECVVLWRKYHHSHAPHARV
jgi:hypothetical protein